MCQLTQFYLDSLEWSGEILNPFCRIREYLTLEPLLHSQIFLDTPQLVLEIVLELFIIGFQLKWTSLLSFALLMLFSLSMVFTIGLKEALDYSVFTTAAASLLLASCSRNARS